MFILSFLHPHRFAYKDEYEKFKLYMTIILMFGAITCLFFLNCRWGNLFPPQSVLLLIKQSLKELLTILFSPFLFRVTDEIFNFLLVWYYCTLTIRESILMSNGSRFALVIFDFSVLGFGFVLAVRLGWQMSSIPVLLFFPGSKAGGCLIIMYPPFCQVWCSPGESLSFGFIVTCCCFSNCIYFWTNPAG